MRRFAVIVTAVQCAAGVTAMAQEPASLDATVAKGFLVEAESFDDHGGWVLDTQFIEIMGSPYLMAHGLGRPVADASTTVTFPATGKWRVWVRTMDWVARWEAPGEPGRFQLLVDGRPVEETFGTKGAEWHWHDGGVVEIDKPTVRLALRDLTGFNGRCDAIYFARGADAAPPPEQADILPRWRRALLGLPEEPETLGPFDLVVVGGGYPAPAAAQRGRRRHVGVGNRSGRQPGTCRPRPGRRRRG